MKLILIPLILLASALAHADAPVTVTAEAAVAWDWLAEDATKQDENAFLQEAWASSSAELAEKCAAQAGSPEFHESEPAAISYRAQGLNFGFKIASSIRAKRQATCGQSAP